MESFLAILGYGFIFLVLAGLFFLVGRLLAGALNALTNNDD